MKRNVYIALFCVFALSAGYKVINHFAGAQGVSIVSEASAADDVQLPSVLDRDDYTGVDCNSKPVRRGIMDLYNSMADDDGSEMLDVYQQTTIEAGPKKLACSGLYELSDYSTSTPMNFIIYESSLGEMLFRFEPY